MSSSTILWLSSQRNTEDHSDIMTTRTNPAIENIQKLGTDLFRILEKEELVDEKLHISFCDVDRLDRLDRLDNLPGRVFSARKQAVFKSDCISGDLSSSATHLPLGVPWRDSYTANSGKLIMLSSDLQATLKLAFDDLTQQGKELFTILNQEHLYRHSFKMTIYRS